MKRKIVILTCILLAGIIAGTTACKKKDLIALVQAFYLSGNHVFASYVAYVFIAGNVTDLELHLPAETTDMYLHMNGTSTGTYTGVGSFSDPSYISLSKGGVNYSSNMAGGAASINWTKRDDDNMWIEGTYTGTVVNQTNPADVIPITNGSFAMKFQF